MLFNFSYFDLKGIRLTNLAHFSKTFWSVTGMSYGKFKGLKNRGKNTEKP